MAIPQKLTEHELQRLVQLVQQTRFSYKLDKYSDAASKEILKSVQMARGEITQKMMSISPSATFTKERLEALSEELQHLTLAAQSQIVGGITQATEIAGAASYTAQNNILSFGGLVPHFNPVTLSAAQLHSMVTTTPIGGRQLNEWVQRTFATDIQESIKSELLTGMLKGESYRDMVNRFGDKVYDGLSHNMETLTKSYVQTANVTAMDDVMKANADIVKGKKWNSVAENRTCLACLALSARDEVYPLDGGPEMPAHPNCRCFWEPVTKTFREMGVNVDEIEKAYRPYTIRGTVDPITGVITPGKIGVGGGRIIETGRFLGTYEDFLKGQSAAVQKQILGPSRLELWQSGKVKLMDFADKNGNVYLLKELRGEVGGGFVPAKTIKEAEEWAIKKGIKITYDGQTIPSEKLKIINSYKDALLVYENKLGIKAGDEFISRISGKTIKFGSNLEISDEISSLIAKQAQGKIYVYSDMADDTKKMLTDIMKTTSKEIAAGEIPLYTWENYTDVMTHELGHTLENCLPKKIHAKWESYFAKTGWKEQASFFGQENAWEMFAESVTSGLKGNIIESGSKNKAFKIIEEAFGKKLKR